MWSGGDSIIAAGIAEKRWRQHMCDFDGGASSTGLELLGKSLVQTLWLYLSMMMFFLRCYLVGVIDQI